MEEIFESYSSDNSAQIYSGKSEYSFRVSNTGNEFNSSNGLSLVDLGECETLLRKANEVPDGFDLIIIKKE